MNNQKSIIGCGYIPRNAQAVCLKTNASARLGEVEYKIVKDPYERTFHGGGTPLEVPHSWEHMAVNVLDANTGLMYAVEYAPANLVRPASGAKTDQPGASVDFATRVDQLSDELNALFDTDEAIFEKCGIALFAISDDANDEASTFVGFIGGRHSRIVEAISVACARSPHVFDVVNKAAVKAIFDRKFGGGTEKK